MTDAIVEIISEFLPESDLLKTVTILMVLFTVTRYPWEWLGTAIRYAVRWLCCYVFKSHSYRQMGGTGNVYRQLMSGSTQSAICHRIEHFA